MNSLEIEGGYKLKGIINPQGSKNEALQTGSFKNRSHKNGKFQKLKPYKRQDKKKK